MDHAGLDHAVFARLERLLATSFTFRVRRLKNDYTFKAEAPISDLRVRVPLDPLAGYHHELARLNLRSTDQQPNRRHRVLWGMCAHRLGQSRASQECSFSVSRVVETVMEWQEFRAGPSGWTFARASVARAIGVTLELWTSFMSMSTSNACRSHASLPSQCLKEVYELANIEDSSKLGIPRRASQTVRLD